MHALSPQERSWLNDMDDLTIAEQRAVTDSVAQLTRRKATTLVSIAAFVGFALMFAATCHRNSCD